MFDHYDYVSRGQIYRGLKIRWKHALSNCSEWVIMACVFLLLLLCLHDYSLIFKLLKNIYMYSYTFGKGWVGRGSLYFFLVCVSFGSF